MTITIPFTLIVIALVLTLLSAITGKVPLWIAVLLICVALITK
jgi:hypothetical protein